MDIIKKKRPKKRPKRKDTPDQKFASYRAVGKQVLAPIQIENETVKDILTRSRAYLNQHRKYPDEMKVLALTLRSAGYTIDKISRITGVAPPTIHDWINDPAFDSVALAELSEGVKDRMANRLYINANTAFSCAMTDEKLKGASFLQLVTGASIMIDKARLLKGESTENISMMSKKIVEVASQRENVSREIMDSEAEIAKLEAEIKKLGNISEMSEIHDVTNT